MAEATATALEIDCRSCGARIVLEEHLRATVCPYCASPAVVERPPAPDRPTPVFAIGFVLDREHATRIARRWLASRGPFAHGGVRSAVLENLRGIYVPCYLYGAEAHARYAADIGEDYTVTETYTTTNAKGQTVTRTRTRTETDWHHLEGEYATWVVDVLVSASRGIPNAELEAVEPFDLRAMVRYTPDLLAGWLAEEPTCSVEECRQAANAESVAKIARALADFMPGDRHRDLDHDVRLSSESTALLLLPVWVLAVRYAPDRAPFRMVLNGQTGTVTGKVPLSPLKIAVAILLGLAVLVLAGLAIAAVAG